MSVVALAELPMFGPVYTAPTNDIRNAGQLVFDEYWDPINGNDSKSGKGPQFAKLTMANAVFYSGKKVGIKRDTDYRGAGFQHDSSVLDNILVGAYGRGAKPRLRGSAVVLNANITKTGGQTNVYEFSATGLPGVGSVINVMEDDVMLSRQSSIANCDANAGSVYISNNEATSLTIYVHPAGSTDPIANGKEYAYTKQPTNMQIDATRVVVQDLQLGDVCSTHTVEGMRRRSRMENCILKNGQKHFLVPTEGFVGRHLTFDTNKFDGVGGGGQLVVFSNDFGASVDSAVIRYCNFKNSVLGFDAHANNGKLVRFQTMHCTFENVLSLASLQQVEKFEFKYNQISGKCDVILGGSIPEETYIQHNTGYMESTGTTPQCILQTGYDGQPFTISDNEICMDQGGNGYICNMVNDNCVGDVRRNIIKTHVWGGYPISPLTISDGKNGNLTYRDNQLIDANGQYGFLLSANDAGPTITWDFDNNIWQNGNATWSIKTVSKQPFATYKAFYAPKEANSTDTGATDPC